MERDEFGAKSRIAAPGLKGGLGVSISRFGMHDLLSILPFALWKLRCEQHDARYGHAHRQTGSVSQSESHRIFAELSSGCQQPYPA